jgi:hypothetical protein
MWSRILFVWSSFSFTIIGEQLSFFNS